MAKENKPWENVHNFTGQGNQARADLPEEAVRCVYKYGVTDIENIEIYSKKKRDVWKHQNVKLNNVRTYITRGVTDAVVYIVPTIFFGVRNSFLEAGVVLIVADAK